MKRLSAILFFLILVFNFYGYRVLISYMENGSDTVMEQRLDKSDYSDEELISIKTKLNLPYYSSSPVFERAYGSINISGVVYEYVQKRVYNDTLELLCLPNSAKTKLQDAKNSITKSVAEEQSSVPVKKGPTTLKISLPDFCQAFETSSVIAAAVSTNYLLRNEIFSAVDFTQPQERPPQAI